MDPAKRVAAFRVPDAGRSNSGAKRGMRGRSIPLAEDEAHHFPVVSWCARDLTAVAMLKSIMVPGQQAMVYCQAELPEPVGLKYVVSCKVSSVARRGNCTTHACA